MMCAAAVCVSAALLVFSAFPIDRRLKNSLILGSAFVQRDLSRDVAAAWLASAIRNQCTTVAILCEITVTSLDLTIGT